MAIYKESTLSTSKLYQDLKELTGSDQTAKAVHLIKTAKTGSNVVKELTKEDIETSYMQIRQYSNSLYREALRAYDNGKTILLYNTDPSQTVNQSIPFLTFNTAKGWVTYVFTDNYVTKDRREGILNFPADRLRDLLIGAVIGNSLKTNYDMLTSNQFLQKILMELYTKLVCRILARDYSIPSNKVLYDKIQYWCNKFFLVNVFNSRETQESIDNISLKHVKYLDEMLIEETINQYNATQILHAEDLINLIRESSPILKTLNIGVFLSSWIKYYYAPSILAIENIEYLIFMIIVLMHGTHSIMNIAAQSLITETKNIKSLNEELLKLIVVNS